LSSLGVLHIYNWAGWSRRSGAPQAIAYQNRETRLPVYRFRNGLCSVPY